ncbi:MAG TPA: hypothetical protein VNW30_09095 [Opitutaceae bacterium]|nr:hypothetical protein [Opitutaceae bacterium]
MSYATDDDLVEASNQGHISPHVTAALKALALESAGPGGRKKASKNMDREYPRRVSESEFSKPLLASPLLRDKNAILSFAKQLGLKLSANPKDSHSRVLSRFMGLLKAMPEQSRIDVLQRLQNEKFSETEGWINVINQRKA